MAEADQSPDDGEAEAAKADQSPDDGEAEAAKEASMAAFQRTAGELVFTHAAVACHNLLWMWVASRGWAVRGESASSYGALRNIAAAVGGTLLTDSVAYFTHLFLDNYVSEKGVLGPLVEEFLFHHKSPKFQLQSFVENGWRESIFASSILLSAIASGVCNLRSSVSTSFWGAFGFWGGQISAIHKAAHVSKPPWIYALGQRYGVIIDRRHHMRHHATLCSHYSLCTGHFEALFERLMGVESVEVLAYLLLGITPRYSRLGLKSGEESRPRIAERLQHLKWSVWYSYFNGFATKAGLGLHFMNWGHCRADGEEYPLPAGAERVLGKDPRIRLINAASLQLYLHLLQGVPLEGRDVAEVSSGRGGFMACLAGSGLARSCTGVDACSGAVETCGQLYADVPGLSFRHGDAMAPLGFSADVVVNVEASHCYPSREGFFRRVHESLKPGGRLLFADFMSEADADKCVAWLEAEGRFEVEIREDITPAVLRAMETTNDAKMGVIKERFPRVVRGFVERFAATEGSKSRGDTSDGWGGALYLHLRALRK
mmetsp:Transcript_108348/g.288319  ORF Transcript_108348/g.288319 Transcript_108348/m.288319 type:complete len:543 (-) Transcript_108348:31-1659(-)